uniref:Ovule protein n=1 Tax=Steinernema glaseri TaxID=37863 RepID=A0A1I8A0W5_9BILA
MVKTLTGSLIFRSKYNEVAIPAALCWLISEEDTVRRFRYLPPPQHVSSIGYRVILLDRNFRKDKIKLPQKLDDC